MVETHRDRSVVSAGSFVPGRKALSLLFWKRGAAVSFQRGLDASVLRRGRSWGRLTVPVDHAVLRPLSEVSRELGLGAKNREWGRRRFFDFSARKCQIVPCLIPMIKPPKPRSLLGLRAAFSLPSGRAQGGGWRVV
jgi:hypothetical protein